MCNYNGRNYKIRNNSLKISVKQLLGLALFIVLIFSLNTLVSASSTITGYPSFETAYSAEYWKFSNMRTTILPENEDAVYFKRILEKKFMLEARIKVNIKE